MKVISYTLNQLKSSLRKPYYSLVYWWSKANHQPKNREELHQYWQKPDDLGNQPEAYLQESAFSRSRFLVDLVSKYLGEQTQSKILEIGCNAGRNLNFLFQTGYKNLEGIEINQQALQLLKSSFPEMANNTKLYNSPVEEAIKKLKAEDYDLIFTMAVLEHIHKESEWILTEIVRINRGFLITVEDEKGISEHHFPRNYKKIFENLNMKEIESISNMIDYGLPDGFVTRVFQKQN